MKILISGAGIAGLTFAYWANHYGFEVEVIEKAKNFKTRRGYIIDFWGPGFDVAEKMNILPALQEKNYKIAELIYLNQKGRKTSSLNIDALRKVLNNRIYTFLRGDLENILLGTIGDKLSIRSGEKIENIVTHKNNVIVNFTDGSQGSYDLIVGADGIHSNVRQLVFGKEEQFSRYLGYRIGAFVHPNTINTHNAFYAYSVPEKQVIVYPIAENKLATFFIYKSAKRIADKAKEALYEHFESLNWRIPDILASLEHSEEIFLDELTQIEMPVWYQDRVVLVGDACQCLTLMAGQGASMAMAGSYTLATLLHQNKNNYQQAFQIYQQLIKPNIECKQKDARNFIQSFVPNTQLGIFFRDLVSKFMVLPFVSKLVFNNLLKEKLVLPELDTTEIKNINLE